MVAAVADPLAKPPVVWREVRCRNPRCRTLLLRYREPERASGAASVPVELVCPDRRCRRMQTVMLPEGR